MICGPRGSPRCAGSGSCVKLLAGRNEGCSSILAAALDQSIRQGPKDPWRVSIFAWAGLKTSTGACPFTQSTRGIWRAGVLDDAPNAETRVVRSLLFGVAATDPLRLFVSAVALALAALLATSLPQPRA
jgi:hypothetical protein